MQAYEDHSTCQTVLRRFNAHAIESPEISADTGRFVNPILKHHQLEYLAYTEAGVSGSVVWTGYNGAPVAVAIHNYGPKRKGPKYGSRGSRIDVKMMREIMEWTGVYRKAVSIIAQPLGKRQPTPPLPLCMAWSE
ncbi:hypothetical protein DER46DRAFT_567071 [Fusarium sp. MPI-SDFR-AT-0072]|nr:hypothetical protein DER46DRAFT_567071 [Fusarium sp. MPI-SDFR-AT-0072]